MEAYIITYRHVNHPEDTQEVRVEAPSTRLALVAGDDTLVERGLDSCDYAIEAFEHA